MTLTIMVFNWIPLWRDHEQQPRRLGGLRRYASGQHLERRLRDWFSPPTFGRRKVPPRKTGKNSCEQYLTSGSDVAPHPICAKTRQILAELGLPIKLVTPFVPPGPKPAREVMKPMLIGVAHGSVYLMHLLGDDPNSDACFENSQP